MFPRLSIVPVIALAALLAVAPPPAAEPLGIALEGFPYPHPVSFLPLAVEGQDLRMAYMDVAPTGAPSGEVVLLLHGKNFPGAYWAATIDALAAAGYRVVVPDQIGFGRSSKPDIHYSFELLAQSTRKILDQLGIPRVTVVGRSASPMFAATMATMKSQWELSLTTVGWKPLRRQASRMWPWSANSGR